MYGLRYVYTLSAICKTKDFSRSQAATYTLYVVVCRTGRIARWSCCYYRPL